jgi:NADPH:quinone reductase-like Zn-dependent oxidoreductase
VIDYTRDDIVDGVHRYDLILDIAGNRPVSHLRRALAPRGTLVITGGESGGSWTGGMHRQLSAHVLSLFVRQRLGTFVAKQDRGHLEALTELIEAGTLAPVLVRTVALADAAQAMRDLEAGHVHGRIALSISPDARG